MTKRMLIDAAHPEETRVVIVDGTRVEELDFESANKRQLRGNVYLAKVTRVEPSLQAAFIDYGGNRHGFLAFSEIHPDYYQIPYEDKLALQQEQEAELAEADDDEDEDVEEDANLDPDDDDASDENDAEVAKEQVKVASRRRRSRSKRRYKIQEVIKRGQILLVQAVKEERGNKGAAMTTYLSLAGRYCVLMPNTPRGGGISRKIANGSDRKRLKGVVDGLDVPQGMGVIVRTAGAKRTKAEITRDYNYLSRLWDDIRETTLKSIAPALIHEEGNLVKRSIRDLYNKEIEEVLVQGDEAYKTAKSFIKMLMPSHAKFVQPYTDDIPLFLRFDVERQIENSLNATVQLKSGGYLVIHPTEALVSVDVNSGRSTKERNVERTALKTNLEAAEELARQMRLRDLAGLIVVDFIDMDENKNNRAVERKMKEVLARDRARIQTGRISQFGLMEMSRQRRRRSLLEGSTTVCRHCDGVGRKRTVESAALAAIREVEEFAIRGKAKKIRLKCPPDVALYLLNEKRDLLTKVDEDADVFTIVEHDDDLIRPAFELEVIEKRNDGRKDPLVAIEKELRDEQKTSARKKPANRSDDENEDDEADAETTGNSKSEDDSESKPRRRRGRRGGRNRRKQKDTTGNKEEQKSSDSEQSSNEEKSDGENTSDDKKPTSRRRRRAPNKSSSDVKADDKPEETASDKTSDDEKAEDKPRRSSSRRKAPARKSSSDDVRDETAKPKRRRRASAKSALSKSEEAAPETRDNAASEEAPKSRRRRAAPKRTAQTAAEEQTESKPAPKRRRTSPAKAKTETEADSESKPAPKRRRKAPAKAAASETKQSEKADTSEEKPTRKRRAPAKKSADAKTDDAPAKPKRTRKKAPTKQAKSKSEDKPAESAEPVAIQKAKPTRRRRAPSKAKAVDEPKTEAKPDEVKPDEEPKVSDDNPSSDRRRKAPSRKKRGLLDRIMGKD